MKISKSIALFIFTSFAMWSCIEKDFNVVPQGFHREETEEETPYDNIPTIEDNSNIGMAFVDLGLSVKWATCNIGANKPEEYGNYYAWGETQPKTTYEWSTYKYCNGSKNTLTKYCTKNDYGTVDNKTTLELSDDIANVVLEGKRRMPTAEEWVELLKKCTLTWIKRNGVMGMEAKGPNGNCIFLPATGYCDDFKNGFDAYYWSSSYPFEDFPYEAIHTYFFYFEGINYIVYSSGRKYGYTVRAIEEKERNTPIVNGAIQAAFSVSNSKKIYFSQGNLLYLPNTNTYRFTEKQYDTNISNSDTEWINWFRTETTEFDLLFTNFYGEGSNNISTIEDATESWRTLTTEEWIYILTKRANASSLFGIGCVNDKNGMILLPDKWEQPVGVCFNSGTAEDHYSPYSTVNNYNLTDWSIMEGNGAVFLPVGDYGEFCFNNTEFITRSNKESGMKRLVQDVK